MTSPSAYEPLIVLGAPHQGGTKPEMYSMRNGCTTVTPPGRWSTSGPLSRGCSQQDSPRQSFLWHPSHVTELRSAAEISPGAQPGGGISGICPPELFKTLYSNFDIWRNFQITKLKFCILFIFKKSLLKFLFVLLVKHLFTRFILRQAIWSKIS